MATSSEKFLQVGRSFLTYVNASPSPFHAVEQTAQRLRDAGFSEVKEREKFDVKPNGKYFFTRNKSSIVAFAIGGKYQKGNGFNIVAAHTDSPCLKIKPVSDKEKNEYIAVGCQTYGGGLWHTWFDRDLKVAGRVLHHDKNKKIHHSLVHIDKPILRIPTLAIHLQRGVNTDGFKFNAETQLLPIAGTIEKLGKRENKCKDNSREYSQKEKHSRAILACVAESLECEIEDILDFELCLADHQPSSIGGLDNEFIFAPRLDNLLSCYTGLEALISATNDADNFANESNVLMLALFDHEEIGSNSAYGAGSSLLRQTMGRIGQVSCPEDLELSIARSVLISADMAHALHPNYADKHEDNLRPLLHRGPVIKFNANQRYATTAITAHILRNLAEKHSVPLQDFCVRNDSSCGSTIGPILSSSLGMRTVDIGNPQLSMHSIREMCGVDDVTHAIGLFTAFYREFTDVEAEYIID